MSSLARADDRTEEQRDRADDHDDELRVGRAVEDRRRAHDQVDAGGHHRRRVDQRRDRRRAVHRVAEPGLQRELRRLAAGGEQQHQADRGQRALARAVGAGEDARRSSRVPNCANMIMMAMDRPKSPTRLTTKAFFAAAA